MVDQALSDDTAAHDITRNPESIWLSPICDDTAHHGEGRTWAAPSPEETCEDCGEPWVKYVRADLASVSSASAEPGTLDWRLIAKAAGEHGVRYRTNTAMAKFLAAVTSPEPVPATYQAGEVERLRAAFAAVEQHFTDFEDCDYNPDVADVQSRAREGLALIRRHMAGVRGAAENVCHSAVDDCTDGRKVFVDPDAFDRLNAVLGDGDYLADLGTLREEKAVAWCSPGQLANLTDVDRDGGVYLPIRKTKSGNFTMPLFAALATQPATSQEGEWVTVPRKPTEAMVNAGLDAENTIASTWSAMLAATPTPPTLSEDLRAGALPIARRLMIEYFGVGKSSAIPADWVLDAMVEFAVVARSEVKAS